MAKKTVNATQSNYSRAQKPHLTKIEKDAIVEGQLHVSTHLWLLFLLFSLGLHKYYSTICVMPYCEGNLSIVKRGCGTTTLFVSPILSSVDYV